MYVPAQETVSTTPLGPLSSQKATTLLNVQVGVLSLLGLGGLEKNAAWSADAGAASENRLSRSPAAVTSRARQASRSTRRRRRRSPSHAAVEVTSVPGQGHLSAPFRGNLDGHGPTLDPI